MKALRYTSFINKTWLLLGLSAWFVSPAYAKSSKKKRTSGPMLIAVENFSGPGGDKYRAAVVRAIESKEGYKVVSASELKAAAKKAKKNKLRSDSDYQLVAEKAGIGAFVSGQGQRKGRKWGAKLRVRNGADGEVASSPAWSATTMQDVERKVENDFWDKVGDALSTASEPVHAAASRDEAVETAAAPAQKNESDAQAQAQQAATVESAPLKTSTVAETSATATKEQVLDAYVGAGMFLRSVSYKDSIRNGPENYPLILWPSAMAQLDFYPMALATQGALARLGIYGSYEMSLAAQSEKNGVQYPTSFSSYGVGLKYRLPLGVHALLISAGYGATQFALKSASASNPKPDLPDAGYTFARAGLGFRFALGSLSLTPQAGYMHLLSLGQVAEKNYYPNAAGAGIEGRLDLGYSLSESFELRLVSRYQRFFFGLKPEPTDSRVAGGMLDQYLDTTVGIAFRWHKGP